LLCFVKMWVVTMKLMNWWFKPETTVNKRNEKIVPWISTILNFAVLAIKRIVPLVEPNPQTYFWLIWQSLLELSDRN
jgi:hypothetical protein